MAMLSDDVTPEQDHPDRARRRAAAVIVGLVLIAIVVVAGTLFLGGSDDPRPDRFSYLGPDVDRLPSAAAFAVLVGPTDLSTKTWGKDDRSALVFVDRELRPVGKLIRRGVFRAQIANVRDGIAFADAQSVTVVRRHDVVTTRIVGTGMMSATASARSADGEALLWFDGGISNKSGGYRSTLVRVAADGTVAAPENIEGRWVSSGWCGNQWRAIIAPGPSEYRAVEPQAKGIRQGPSWKATAVQHGAWVPWTCYGNHAFTHQWDGQTVLPNRGAEIRSVDFATLATRSAGFHTVGRTKDEFQAALRPWDGVVATEDAWWDTSSGRRFVNSHGSIMQLDASGKALKQVGALNLFNNADTRIDAADVVTGNEALLFGVGIAGGRIPPDNARFVIFDLKALKATRTIPRPEWLRRLVGEVPSLSIQDVSVVRMS